MTSSLSQNVSKHTIPIVLAFDANFWAPAYATMRSICLFSRRRDALIFHLCCRGITEAQRLALEKINQEFGATLMWHELERDDMFNAALAGLKDSKRLGKVIYARLMLEHFVSGNARRAIYLDCDMMVREPIEHLMEMPLDGMAIGAVRDPGFPLYSMARDIRSNSDLFDAAQRYFNSGMLLIDLEQWRRAGVWERLRTMIADGTLARIYYDQDVLNLIFKDRWKELDYRWNLIDPRPAHQAIDPFILHFTGKRKPWNLVSGVAFARLYRHVMTNEVYYSFWRERVKRRWARLFRAGRGKR